MTGSFIDRLLRRLGPSPGRAAGDARSLGALIYRGPAAEPGCPESIGDVLKEVGIDYRFVGPGEKLGLTRAALADAALYVQPGGGEVEECWPLLAPHAPAIRDFVAGGGRYLGVCLGAYLASDDPGFGLLPGRAARYISMRGASIRHPDDAIVTVRWRGRPRQAYFQDGPYFKLKEKPSTQVLGRYPNDAVAAAVCRFGAGRVGVVGPHLEATADWFTDVGIDAPATGALDLACDLLGVLLAPEAEADHAAD
ncbi:MAG: BPL-N domain-containing protein [Micrococcales bacterium]|nr:BPL-N domain-containing protein [Micrococcales bacterium]